MKIEWKKVDSDWYEKRIINERGIPHITYHYRRKSAPPIPTILLQTKLAQKLCGYILIKKDVNDTILFIEEHNKLYQTSGDVGSNIILKGLTRAIVITYGKCFTQADGRKTWLNSDVIKSKNNLSTHELLIEMRNQYIAHAGNSIHEKVCLPLLCPPPKVVKKILRGKNVKGNIVLGQQLIQTTSIIEFNDGTVLSLLNELQIYIDEKIATINRRLGIENIDPPRLWNLLKKKKILGIDEDILEQIVN